MKAWPANERVVKKHSLIKPCLTPVRSGRLTQAPGNRGWEVCWSELKGRHAAGDYGQEANVKVKTDSARPESALSVCFYGLWGPSQLSLLLIAAASITLVSNEGKSEKSILSFPLIMCVYPITISKANSLLSNDYCAERAKLYHVFAGILMWYVFFYVLS